MMCSTGAWLAPSPFSSPFIKRTSALVSEKIYTPWKRGGELAQIYEHRLQWQDTGSCYLTFEQRMWKKIGDGRNRKLEQQKGGEGLEEWMRHELIWNLKLKKFVIGEANFWVIRLKRTKSSIVLMNSLINLIHIFFFFLKDDCQLDD